MKGFLMSVTLRVPPRLKYMLTYTNMSMHVVLANWSGQTSLLRALWKLLLWETQAIVGDPSDSKGRKYSGGTFPEGSFST